MICPKCDGEGDIEVLIANEEPQSTCCPKCGGKGEVWDPSDDPRGTDSATSCHSRHQGPLGLRCLSPALQRLRDRLIDEANVEFDKDVAAGLENPEARADFVHTFVTEALADAEHDAACDLDEFDYPEDTPCLEQGVHNCNDWGTGEGQFHGRM